MRWYWCAIRPRKSEYCWISRCLYGIDCVVDFVSLCWSTLSTLSTIHSTDFRADATPSMSQAQHQSFHFPDFPRRRERAKRFSTQRDFPSSDGFFLFYDEDSRGAKHGDALSSLILHTSFSNLFAITNGRFAFGLLRI